MESNAGIDSRDLSATGLVRPRSADGLGDFLAEIIDGKFIRGSIPLNGAVEGVLLQQTPIIDGIYSENIFAGLPGIAETLDIVLACHGQQL